MNPVARVAVDVPLAHLDRPFDYLVPERLAAQAVPGCRVRVRFNGLLVNGFVLARAAASEFAGGLQPLTRVVSAEPVLSAEVAGLARAVADRYAGTLADVLRLAVPPRRAAVEREPLVPPGVPAYRSATARAKPATSAESTGSAETTRVSGCNPPANSLAAARASTKPLTSRPLKRTRTRHPGTAWAASRSGTR